MRERQQFTAHTQVCLGYITKSNPLTFCLISHHLVHIMISFSTVFHEIPVSSKGHCALGLPIRKEHERKHRFSTTCLSTSRTVGLWSEWGDIPMQESAWFVLRCCRSRVNFCRKWITYSKRIGMHLKLSK